MTFDEHIKQIDPDFFEKYRDLHDFFEKKIYNDNFNNEVNMPYRSKAQQAKFHILEKQGKISKATVDEFDKASKGKKLPNKIKKERK